MGHGAHENVCELSCVIDAIQRLRVYSKTETNASVIFTFVELEISKININFQSF